MSEIDRSIATADVPENRPEPEVGERVPNADYAIWAVVIFLCILCCVLFLIIPTQSISVDTIYQGF